MTLLRILPLSSEVRELYKTRKEIGYKGDSGFDFFVAEDQTIAPHETAFLKLGIKVAAYKDTLMNHSANQNQENNAGTTKRAATAVSWLLLPRSSISKTPLRLSNSIGLIDAGYRGEIIAAVDNIKDYPHTVRKGERLVQAVAFDGGSIDFEVVESLDATDRGTSGFGSTSFV